MILQQLYESLTDHAGSTEYSYAQFLSHRFNSANILNRKELKANQNREP
jgi:hypothetical protein